VSGANIDHLTIGPGGITVIDGKRLPWEQSRPGALSGHRIA
jgi:hypothetical protein